MEPIYYFINLHFTIYSVNVIPFILQIYLYLKIGHCDYETICSTENKSCLNTLNLLYVYVVYVVVRFCDYDIEIMFTQAA